MKLAWYSNPLNIAPVALILGATLVSLQPDSVDNNNSSESADHLSDATATTYGLIEELSCSVQPSIPLTAIHIEEDIDLKMRSLIGNDMYIMNHAHLATKILSGRVWEDNFGDSDCQNHPYATYLSQYAAEKDPHQRVSEQLGSVDVLTLSFVSRPVQKQNSNAGLYGSVDDFIAFVSAGNDSNSLLTTEMTYVYHGGIKGLSLYDLYPLSLEVGAGITGWGEERRYSSYGSDFVTDSIFEHYGHPTKEEAYLTAENTDTLLKTGAEFGFNIDDSLKNKASLLQAPDIAPTISGTSFASPEAGRIAMRMLEEYPNITKSELLISFIMAARDYQMKPLEDEHGIKNAAGYTYNLRFGHGYVDEAALEKNVRQLNTAKDFMNADNMTLSVRASEKWQIDENDDLSNNIEIDVPLVNVKTTGLVTISLPKTALESKSLPKRATLESPSGTRIIVGLHPDTYEEINDPTQAGDPTTVNVSFGFKTTAFFGENSAGQWKFTYETPENEAPIYQTETININAIGIEQDNIATISMIRWAALLHQPYSYLEFRRKKLGTDMPSDTTNLQTAKADSLTP